MNPFDNFCLKSLEFCIFFPLPLMLVLNFETCLSACLRAYLSVQSVLREVRVRTGDIILRVSGNSKLL